SDIFSLGIVLYEMTTGRRPFSGATATETINQIINAEPARICQLNARIPTNLEWRITRCLKKNPDHRYQTARELLSDLSLELEGLQRSPQKRSCHNLPLQLTSFVGREQEIAEVTGLIRKTRLLALTGTGGIGKTRLALRAAEEVQGDYNDG